MVKTLQHKRVKTKTCAWKGRRNRPICLLAGVCFTASIAWAPQRMNESDGRVDILHHQSTKKLKFVVMVMDGPSLISRHLFDAVRRSEGVFLVMNEEATEMARHNSTSDVVSQSMTTTHAPNADTRDKAKKAFATSIVIIYYLSESLRHGTA
jgi:hypothetical protein